MKTVNVQVEESYRNRIAIGRRGETEATEIVFDVSQLISTYGDGTAQLVAKLPNSTDPYPVSVTQDGSTVTWLVTNADTQAAGNGECELFWYVGDVLAKSVVYTTVIGRDIGDVGEEPPESYETWVEQVLAAGAAAAQSAEDAAEAAASIQRIVIDDALSDTSENPVQNKVVTAAFDQVFHVDSTPTPNSAHYMLSGGIYSALEKKISIPIPSPEGSVLYRTSAAWIARKLTASDVGALPEGTPIPSTAADVGAATAAAGVPTGGTAGQVLAKASGTDYDTEWVDQSGGGSSGVFIAAYGTTTSAEIEAAYQDGKSILCQSGGNTYVLTHRASATNHLFARAYTDTYPVMEFVRCTNSAWAVIGPLRLVQFYPGDTSDGDTLVYDASDNEWKSQAPVSDLYVCEYGTTTFAELSAAISAGKLPICQYGNYLYIWAGVMNSRYYFFNADTGTLRVLTLTQAGTWAISSAAIPTKTSDLTNDSGFITSAPVSSVNGQTGAVVLSIPSTASDVDAAPAVTEVTISTAGDVTAALDAGKIYHFTGAVSSLTLTLSAAASGILPQYHFDFDSGSTAATVSVSGVTWPDGSFTPEASKHYEVDILGGYAVVMAW